MYRARKHFFNLLLVSVIAISATVVFGQLTATGDLVFTGWQSSGFSAVTDQFTFVPLKNLPVGSVIKFTDNAWNSNSSTFNTTEANYVFTVTPNAILAGREIRLIGGPPAVALFQNGTSAGTVVATGAFSMPTTGEQMFAYLGPDLAPTVFLSGIHMNVESVCGITTSAGWDPAPCVFPASPNNNTSMKPAALTTGTNAFWSTVEHDNGRFTGCGLVLSTAAAVRAAVNNPANWFFEDPAGAEASWSPNGPFAGCAFLGIAPTAANVSVSGRVTTANDNGVRNAIVVLTNSQGESKSTRTGTFGYYRFDEVQAGETYVISVNSKLFQFSPRTISVSDELTDVDFVADSGQTDVRRIW
jgi:hypothetical protein